MKSSNRITIKEKINSINSSGFSSSACSEFVLYFIKVSFVILYFSLDILIFLCFSNSKRLNSKLNLATIKLRQN